VVKTAHPLVKAILALLSTGWPHRFSFQELLQRSRETARDSAHAYDDAALAATLWDTCRCGLVRLHAHAGRFALRAGEYPLASAIARLDVREGAVTSTLAHEGLRVEDGGAKRLLEALDGTRNRAALALELNVSLAEIEDGLAKLARLPILMA
jgi:hypothetical protein